MKALLSAALLVCTILAALAQHPLPTNAAERLLSYNKRLDKIRSSPIRNIAFENVGPTVFSGRVVDIAVNPEYPQEFFVAYASGGLWYTRNNGASFLPLFDKEAVMTIGAIAVDWVTGTIWVGTGEVNSSRSSYAGIGIYVSRDKGETWQHSGLAESHHIGRIVLHPTNPDLIWVASMGHLYSDNLERGVYKSTDGGLTWTHSLKVNEKTGAIDLVLDPHTPDHVYAAMWQRKRQAWNFEESGPGSGIYCSTDAGVTWVLCTDSLSGFPSGAGCGRIGLTTSFRDGKTIVFAIVDNYNLREKKETAPDTNILSLDALKTMSVDKFLTLSDKKLEAFLRTNKFPEKYTTTEIRSIVKSGQIKPIDLSNYHEDANANLFNTQIIGPQIYRLDGQNKTWQRTHDPFLDDLFYTYGYYFGQIRAQPDNPDILYILGVPVLRSEDGGKTFTSIQGENVHVDHHALWINPKNPEHLLLGNDGGANLSYDRGNTWTRLNRPPVGQFYAIAVDNAEPFNIYGGLQDNGVWKGPSKYPKDLGWEMNGRYPYENVHGGDGMQVQVDPREENRIIYTGYQFGNYFRIDTRTKEKESITPRHDIGEAPYRWNWQTPIHLSTHNPDILYMGSHRMLRSMDKGQNFEPISEDLTNGRVNGDIPFGTLTSIHESPMRFGLLYTGSDDGLAFVSKDAGYTWQNISEGLPSNLWISRIIGSQHVEGRVYISLNGYRWDHFNTYLYQSDDYGLTWHRIGTDLPDEPVNVIREDAENQHILYVGTDHGLFTTLNGGITFFPFEKNLPHVPIHDIALHQESNTLVVGTHGRSLYTANIELLRGLDTLLSKDLHVFHIPNTSFNLQWGKSNVSWIKPERPTLKVTIYSSESGTASWTIYPENEKYAIVEGVQPIDMGLNFWNLDLEITHPTNAKKWRKHLASKSDKLDKMKLPEDFSFLLPGTYTIEILRASQKVQTRFVIE
ncbi:MAG: glycosyl hydrolase [Saprospiraceae bacterium]|nr:glycosyl hydrolase [Saprospiraceae bacterium]